MDESHSDCTLFVAQEANSQPSLLYALAPKIVLQRILHYGHTETCAKSMNTKQRGDRAGSGIEQSRYHGSIAQDGPWPSEEVFPGHPSSC
ncbi:hypothetical protein TNCV_4275101 [Trichonephila clavipes]|nr:hypothetical protein TNCV_4275101 [Trichonephila clavipes]